MNKIYKVIWSKVKNCWVVASELAKSHTKSPKSGIVGEAVLGRSVLLSLYQGHSAVCVPVSDLNFVPVPSVVQDVPRTEAGKKDFRITVAAIVKNEAKNVPQWVEAARSCADEIVVVDTGSTDGTVERFADYGIKCFHYDWNDDFASAKNYMISLCHGDWIVLLDGDEWFREGCDVRKAIAKHHGNPVTKAIIADWICLDTTRNNSIMFSGGAVRAFRNLPDVRYFRKVHENLTIKYENFVFEPDFRMYHTGYSGDVNRSKHERNLRIMRTMFDFDNGKVEFPTDWRYIQDTYAGLGEFWKSLEASDRMIAYGIPEYSAASWITRFNVLFAMKTPMERMDREFDYCFRTVPSVSGFRFLASIYYFRNGKVDKALDNYIEGLRMLMGPQDKVAMEHTYWRMYMPEASALASAVYLQNKQVEASLYACKVCEQYCGQTDWTNRALADVRRVLNQTEEGLLGNISERVLPVLQFGKKAVLATAIASSLTVGMVGVSNPVFASCCNLNGVTTNKTTGNHSTVVGGECNTASGEHSSVSGGVCNTASGARSSVSGGNCNTASCYNSSVSGGYKNTASCDNSSVSGGSCNTASGYSSSVSGGCCNTAGKVYSYFDTVDGFIYVVSPSCTAANFSNNTITVTNPITGQPVTYNLSVSSGFASTVTGGYQNNAGGCYSSVFGGICNFSACCHSTILGGQCNISNGLYSTIVGGCTNLTSGIRSAIFGGDFNVADDVSSTVVGGDHNKAHGMWSTVVGGASNYTGEDYAASFGGEGNKAFATRSTVLGGQSGKAYAEYSTVIGGGIAGCSSNSGIASNSVAIGRNATTTRENEIAIGSTVAPVKIGGNLTVTGSQTVTDGTTTKSWTELLNATAISSSVYKDDGDNVFVYGDKYSSQNQTYNDNTNINAILGLWMTSGGNSYTQGACESVAIGKGTIVAGNYNIGIGNVDIRQYYGNPVQSKETSKSVAIGYDSKIQGSSNSVVIGSHASVVGNDNSIALGYNSQANAENAIALGSLSIADVANTVSVGSDYFNRKIVNVADGTDDHDAVTVGQLNTALVNAGCFADGVVLAGCNNTASGCYSSVSGGSHNTASGDRSSVSGGICNIANACFSSVSGGYRNTASCNNASVSGGFDNNASGLRSSVSGGECNIASGCSSSVSGGSCNTASGCTSSVSGGSYNTASGYTASVSGGAGNMAVGGYSSVSGGIENIANCDFSSVSGGYCNTASCYYSSVSGGFGNNASGESSSVSSGRCNTASGNASWVAGGCCGIAYADYSSAIGGGVAGNADCSQTALGSVAIGKSATTTRDYEVAIGSSCAPVKIDGALTVDGAKNITDGTTTKTWAEVLEGGSLPNTLALGTCGITAACASGTNSLAIGEGAVASGDKAISIGTGNQVRGDNSGAFGDPNIVDANNSYTVGNNSTISANVDGAFVLGNNVTVNNGTLPANWDSLTDEEKSDLTGEGAIALGNNVSVSLCNKVNSSRSSNSTGSPKIQHVVAVGDSAIVGEENAVALGYQAEAKALNALASGTCAKALSEGATALGQGSIVHENSSFATAVGYEAEATGEGANAFGDNAVAGDKFATAFGRATNAQCEASTAIGNEAVTTGKRAVAIGNESVAGGEGATSVGNNSNAVTRNAVSIGNQAVANGEGVGVVAIGNCAQVGTATSAKGSSTAVGAFANVQSTYSTALGAQTSVTANNSVALGAGSVASQANVVSVGAGTATDPYPATRKIINVTDGTANTDVSTVGQTGRNLALSGSTLSLKNANGTVLDSVTLPSAPTYTAGNGLELDTNNEFTVKAGTNVTVDANGVNVAGNGTVASGNTGLVSGGTLHSEVRPASDGNYITTTGTTGSNLTALDTQLKTTADNLATEITNRTNADTALSNRIGSVASDGTFIKKSDTNDVATNLTALDTATKNAIKTLSVSGTTITYTKGDGTTGTITTQDNNTTYTAGCGLILTGTEFSAKAGTNVTVDANGINVVGNGSVASGNTGLISGGTLYSEARPTANGNYITTVNKVGANLTALDTAIKNADNSAIKSITSNGTTVTFTKGDGTTGTFTTQDNDTTYGTGTASDLTTGTDTTAKVWTSKVLADYVKGEVSTETTARTNADTDLSNRIGSVASDGNYIKASSTKNVAENLGLLDTQVKVNATAISNEVANRTTAVTNEASARDSADTALGTRIDGTIKDLSVSGQTITYTKGDGTTGTITTQDNNTQYTAGNGMTLTGTEFSAKAGTNVTVDANGINVVGNGAVVFGNTGLVSGGTLYGEVRPVSNGNYISTANTAGANLTALDTAIKANADAISASNDSAVKYDDTSKATITLEGSNGTKITNLKNGNISSASTDAVTGSQLYAVNQSVVDEVASRTNADTALGTRIDNVISAYQTADTNLSNRIGSLTADGNYIKKADTKNISENLSLLDAQLKTTADGLATEVTNRTNAINTEATAREGADTALGERIDGTITDLSVDGRTITYTKGDGTTGTITTQDNNTEYIAGNGLTLTGTEFSAKAGTNVSVDANGINVVGNGVVASGNTGLVSGGTLYNEVRPTSDGNYIAVSNTAGANLSALDSQLKTVTDGLATETTNRTGADVALGNRIGTVASDGNYIKASSSKNVSENLGLLDVQMKANADAIAQEVTDRGTAVSNEATARSTEDTNLSNRIGSVATDGNYIKSSLNKNVAENLGLLDTAIKANADAIAGLTDSDTTYTAGNGLELNGTVFTAKAGDHVSVTENGINVTVDGTVTENNTGIVSGGTVYTAVNAEKTARESADTTLQTNIANEKTARESADTALQTNIDSEVTARETAVLGEATARANADTTLQGNIDTLSNIAVKYDSADTKDKVTLTGTNGTTIDNVKDATLSAASKEAVTGSQLFATNTNIATEVTNRTNADTALSDRIGTVSANGNYIKASSTYDVAQNLGALDTAVKANADAIDANKVHFFKVNSSDTYDNNYNGEGATGGGAIAIGQDIDASGVGGIAIGTLLDATSLGSIAIGSEIVSSGVSSIGMGDASLALSDYSIALGSNAGTSSEATNAVAIGHFASATGVDSVAIGTHSDASEDNTVSFGTNAYGSIPEINRRLVHVATGINDTDAVNVKQLTDALGDQKIEYVGINAVWKDWADLTDAEKTVLGVTTEAEYDALVVGSNRNGEWAVGENSIAIGKGAKAGYHLDNNGNVSSYGNDNIAIGTNAYALNTGGVAIGKDAYSNGGTSVAIGQESVGGTNGVAIGYKAKSNMQGVSIGNEITVNPSGENVVAIGYQTTVTGANGIGIGTQTATCGSFATAVGDHASASGTMASAFGQKADASGDWSIALGQCASSVGSSAVALGQSAVGQGSNSIAAGYGAQTVGSFATAVGKQALGNGQSSVAVGDSAKAQAERAVAIGGDYSHQTVAGAPDSIAIGSCTNVSAVNGIGIGLGTNVDSVVSGEKAIAIGYGSSSNSQYSIAIGNNSKARSKDAVSLGNGASSTSLNSIAVGSEISSTGLNSVAIGSNTEELVNSSRPVRGAFASNAVAIGNNPVSSGSSAISMGTCSHATCNNAIAIGNQSSASTLDSIAIGTMSDSSSNGGIAIGYMSKNNLAGGLSLGNYSKAGEHSVALGNESNAGYVDGATDIADAYSLATAVGYGSTATNGAATALGAESSATGEQSVAVGILSNASGNRSIAIGLSANASGEDSISIGHANRVNGDHSGAIGDPTVIDGDNSYSVGNNNKVASDTTDVFAFGNSINTTASDVVVFGKESAGSETGTVSVGHKATDLDVNGNAYGTALNRKIVNVAAGVNDTDAVNVSQLTSSLEDKADTDLGNITSDGEDVVKTLAKGSVNVVGDGKASVSKSDVAGVDTYTVSVTANGTVTENNADIVTGGTVYNALQQTVSDVNDALDLKANKDASNVSANTAQWGTAIGTGAVAENNGELVTGGTVYTALHAQNTATQTALDGKANVSLDNIDADGQTVVRDLAKEAVKVVAGTKTTVTEGSDGNAKTYAVNVTTDGAVAQNNDGIVTGGTVYNALQAQRLDIQTDLVGKANVALDNITTAGHNVIKADAKSVINVVGSGKASVEKTTVTGVDTYTVSVNADGDVAEGNSNIVTGGTVYEAIRNAITGSESGTGTALDGKANKDASNVSDYASEWATAIGTGTVAENNGQLVTGGTVYTAVQGEATARETADTALGERIGSVASDGNYIKASTDNNVAENLGLLDTAIKANADAVAGLGTDKANVSLDNISSNGETVIRELAKGSVKVVDGMNTTVTQGTDGDYKTYAVNVATDGTVSEGNMGIVNGGTVYTAIRNEATARADADTAINNRIGQLDTDPSAYGYISSTNTVSDNLAALDDAVLDHANQIGNFAMKDASNIGRNAAVDNSEQWGAAIGAQSIEFNDNRLVTSGTMYDELKLDANGNYVQADNTTAENIASLDTTLKNTNDSIEELANSVVRYDDATKSAVTLGTVTQKTKVTNVADATLSATSSDAVTGKQLYETNQALAGLDTGKANVDLDNLSDAGKDVIKDSVNVVGSGKVTVNKTDVSGTDTYTVGLTVDGAVANGNEGLVTGGQVADAISTAVGSVTGDMTEGLADKANKDASNVSANTAQWGTAIGTGVVAENNGELVTGGTVYTALQAQSTATQTALDGKANVSLDNLDNAGNTVLQQKAIASVKVADGDNTTVTSELDADGNKTYKVKANATGSITSGDTGLVNGDTVYTAIQNEATARGDADITLSDRIGTVASDGNYIKSSDGKNVSENLGLLDVALKNASDSIASLDTDKANIALDNITTEGETVIRDLAKGSVKVVAGNKTTVTEGTDGDYKTYVVNVSVDGAVADGNGGLVTGGDVYSAIRNAVAGSESGTGTALEGKANVSLDNVAEAGHDVIKSDAKQAVNVVGDGKATVTKSDVGGVDTYQVSVNANGSVADGNTDIVSGGTVYNAMRNMSDDILTTVNDGLDGKADVDASNVTDAQAWATKLGTGTVDSADTKLVTGATVAGETRVVSDGNYVLASNTAGQNISALDARVKANADNIVTNASDISDLKDLSNITETGRSVIKELSKGSVNVTGSGKATVTKSDVAGVDTYNVEVLGNGSVADGNDGLVTGGTVYTAIRDAVSASEGGINTALDGKANVDASNVTDSSAWASKLDTGTVVQDNSELVSGGKVYTAVKDAREALEARIGTIASDGNYISKDASVSDNLVALDTQTKANADAVSVNSSEITNLKDLSNITSEGQTVIKNLSKDSVKVVNGANTTVTEGVDGEAKTYAVNVVANGTVSDGDTGIVTGGVVKEAIDGIGSSVDTRLEDYAKKDASNVADAEAWGNRIATGAVADGDVKSVSGSTVYNALENAKSEIATAMGNGLDGKANVGLDNIGADGTSVIRNIAKGAVSLADGENTTVSSDTDTDGNVTYRVKANATGTVSAGNTGLVDGGTVYTAIADAVSVSETNTNTALDGKANVDASNITDASAWGGKLGVGEVADGNDGLVKGGTVYNALSALRNDVRNGMDGKADVSLGNIDADGQDVIRMLAKGSVAVAGNADVNVNKTVENGKDVYGLSLAKDGVVESANTGVVTGGTVYDALGGMRDGLQADIDQKASKDLSDITADGQNVVKTIAQNASKVVAGRNTTVTEGTDGEAKTYAVNVDADGTISENNDGVVSGGTVYNAIKSAKEEIGTSFNETLDGYAKKDASNIEVDRFTEKLDTGSVSENDTGLVSGGKVYDAVKSVRDDLDARVGTMDTDGGYVSKDASVNDNLKVLDTQVKANADAIAGLSTFDTDRAVMYNDASKDSITLAGNNGTVIRNVADGALSEDSREAVNGRQLYATNTRVQANADAVSALEGRIGTTSAGSYVDGNKTVGENLNALDTQVKANADAVGQNAQDIQANATAIRTVTDYVGSVRDGAYVDASKTVGENINTLDTKVKDNSDRIGAVENTLGGLDTRVDGKLDNDLGNLASEGETVIRNIAKNSVNAVSEDGSVIITQKGTDTKTFDFAVKKDGRVEEGNNDVVTGGTVYQALQDLDIATPTNYFGVNNSDRDDLNYTGGGATGTDALAAGVSAEAQGTDAIAIGHGSKAFGDKSIALGTGNRVTGDNSGAFGDPNEVSGNGSYAFGNDNTVSGDNTFVLGNNVSNASGNNSVVLGDGSDGSQDNVVSVGAKGRERKVVHVADGEIVKGSTDAVNGGQMFDVRQDLREAKDIDVDKWSQALGTGQVAEGDTGLVNGGQVYTAVNNVAKSFDGLIGLDDGGTQINVGSGTQYDGADVVNFSKSDGSTRVLNGIATDPQDATSAANVGYVNAVGQNIIDGVNREFTHVNDRMDKVGAGAAAMAGLVPGSFDDGEKWNFSAAVGNYRSATAGAVGMFYKPAENVTVAVKGAFGNGENMVAGGVGIALSKGDVPGVTKRQLARTVNAQAAAINNLKAEQQAKDAKHEAEIAELKAQIAELAKIVKANNNK